MTDRPLGERAYTGAMPRLRIHNFWRSPELPFVELRCANDSTACYAPHAHASLSLGCVDSGESVFRREGGGERGQQRLTGGDVVFIPPGEVHSCNPADDGRWSYQMLYLDPQWVETLVGEMGALDAVVLNQLPAAAFPLSPQRIHARLSALNDRLFGNESAEEKLAALVLFVGDLFGAGRVRALGRELKPDAGRLNRVKAMIAARCAESLTLDELAQDAGMSRYHFLRLFRRYVGMTPHAFQLDQRIQQARQYLDHDMPLAEIALQLGFSDQSHFQRAFKQRVAATPGEYQRSRSMRPTRAGRS